MYYNFRSLRNLKIHAPVNIRKAHITQLSGKDTGSKRPLAYNKSDPKNHKGEPMIRKKASALYNVLFICDKAYPKINIVLQKSTPNHCC